MTNEELIDRYSYAVTKELPKNMRSDVDKELRTIISDMLDERCGELAPEEKDVRVVLAELGTPSELAAKYDPDGERSLIGPKYYRKYKRTMPIILGALTCSLIFAGIISLILGEGSWESVTEWIADLWQSLIGVFGLCTLVFAILERKNVDISGDDIAKLPAVPKKREIIPKADCIIGIVFDVLFMVIFIFAPQIICGRFSFASDGVTHSATLFNVDVMKSLWYAWGILFIVGVFNECFKLYKGRHDYSTAIVRAVTGVIEIIMTFLVFGRSDIINTQGLMLSPQEDVGTLTQQDVAVFNKLAESLGNVLLTVIIVCIAIDMAVSIVKGIKYGRQNEV